MSPREAELIELVSPAGAATGVSTVEDAHAEPGLLHRAFSVLLVDPDGRLLLQQRAAPKTRFALRWANACCGHPRPDEPVADAANRRLAEELGMLGMPLREVGVYVYRAVDPASGRVEHEYDHVLVGRAPGRLIAAPDPAEVADLRWIEPQRLAAGLADEEHRYAPWLAGVVATWRASPETA